MEERYFNYKGKRLFYRAAGSGPLVVLVHGFPEDGTAWKAQFSAFPDHQLIVPDLPGSGRSEIIDDMSMEGLADVVHALVKGLTPNPSPRGEGSEVSENLEGVDDSQRETGHYFKTADTSFWKTAKEYGRINRKNPTEAEDLLWQKLRDSKLGVKVRRQHSIGGYVVDFAVLEIKLIIEVDGDYHDNPDQKALDRVRQDELRGKGYSVLRFTNEEVTSRMQEVLQQIKTCIAQIGATLVLPVATPLSARRGAGGEAIIIGHSMGGYITLAFAERHPDALTAFGLFHSTAAADSEERKETRRKAIQTVKAQGTEDFLKTFIPRLYSPSTKEKAPALIDEHLTSVRNFSAEALVKYFEAMMTRPDRTAVLQETEVPVLFVMGKYDKAVPPEEGLKQVHLPQLAHVHLLQASAHEGMLEEAAETNKILTQFVNAVEDIA